jgi:hypothetical protein
VSEPKTMPLERQKGNLQRAALEEMCAIDPQFTIPVHLDIPSALSLIGNLQLALRHPANEGPSATIARKFIDGLIDRMITAGLYRVAELAKLGDDPAYDEPRAEPS